MAGNSNSYGLGSNAMCIINTDKANSVTDSIIKVTDSSALAEETNGTNNNLQFQGEYNSNYVEAVLTSSKCNS